MGRCASLGTLALSLVLLAGCTPKPKITFDPDANWSQYKTFMQAPAPKTSKNLVGYSEITGRQIQAEIARQLESKGLRPADRGQGNLLVVFSISGQERQDQEYEGYGYGYGYGNGYTVRYVEGTMIVDIYDHAQKKLLFHGYEQREIFSQDNAGPKALESVDQILQDFPPGSAPQGN